MMNYLTVKDIEELHQEQIDLHGGISGIRDINLLESAVNQIQQMCLVKNSIQL